MNEKSLKMFTGAPPDWALERSKSTLQHVYDFLGLPLRLILLPDHLNERLHLTSLRAERLSIVLEQMRGRCLDIGAGDNMLINLYRRRTNTLAASQSVGVDVVDWGGDSILIENSANLPFEAESFDTVSFVACLNHIPERVEALNEAARVLKPEGKLVVTMIGNVVGKVGHALWWYSEDKHRQIAPGEVMGMDDHVVDELIRDAGFSNIQSKRFVYGLNRMVIASR